MSIKRPFKVYERAWSIQKWVPKPPDLPVSFHHLPGWSESLNVIKISGGSYVPWGSTWDLLKVTSTCLPCRICPGRSLEALHPFWGSPPPVPGKPSQLVTPLPRLPSRGLYAPNSIHHSLSLGITLLSYPVVWALAPTVPTSNAPGSLTFLT